MVFVGKDPETTLIAATFWGYGGILTLLTIAGANAERHYLVAVAPLMALWAAAAVFYGDRTPAPRRARAILIALCVGQAALSAGLLGYIHQTGIILDEYGATWYSQQPGSAPH